MSISFKHQSSCDPGCYTGSSRSCHGGYGGYRRGSTGSYCGGTQRISYVPSYSPCYGGGQGYCNRRNSICIQPVNVGYGCGSSYNRRGSTGSCYSGAQRISYVPSYNPCYGSGQGYCSRRNSISIQPVNVGCGYGGGCYRPRGYGYYYPIGYGQNCYGRRGSYGGFGGYGGYGLGSSCNYGYNRCNSYSVPCYGIGYGRRSISCYPYGPC